MPREVTIKTKFVLVDIAGGDDVAITRFWFEPTTNSLHITTSDGQTFDTGELPFAESVQLILDNSLDGDGTVASPLRVSDSFSASMAALIQAAVGPVSAKTLTLEAQMASTIQRVAALEAGTPISNLLRTASPLSWRAIHCGHSLTDVLTNQPHPGGMLLIKQSLGGTGTDLQATIPGSSTEFRWINHATMTNDARLRIGEFDELFITERGLDEVGVAGPDMSDLSEFRTDLQYLLNWTDLAYREGKGGQGAPTTLYSTWAAIDGSVGDPIAVTADYGRRFRWRADWVNHHMKLKYPNLPARFHMFIMPGHLMMGRLMQDAPLGLIPGVTAIEDLFSDYIHPNDLGCAAMSYFGSTYEHQLDLTGRAGLWQPSYVSDAQRDYFCTIAYEILSDYAGAGMGGTTWDRLGFDPVTDNDPVRNPTWEDGQEPEPEPGDEPPAARLAADASNAATLFSTYAGTKPTVANGRITFPTTDNGLRSTTFQITTGTFYVAVAIDVTDVPEDNIARIAAVSPNGAATAPPEAVLQMNTSPTQVQFYSQLKTTSAGPEGANLGYNAPTTGWVIVESWVDGTDMGGAINGGADVSVIESNGTPLGNTRDLTIGDNGWRGTPNIVLAGMRIMDRKPTPAERVLIRNWLQARIDAAT